METANQSYFRICGIALIGCFHDATSIQQFYSQSAPCDFSLSVNESLETSFIEAQFSLYLHSFLKRHQNDINNIKILLWELSVLSFTKMLIVYFWNMDNSKTEL